MTITTQKDIQHHSLLRKYKLKPKVPSPMPCLKYECLVNESKVQ